MPRLRALVQTIGFERSLKLYEVLSLLSTKKGKQTIFTSRAAARSWEG